MPVEAEQSESDCECHARTRRLRAGTDLHTSRLRTAHTGQHRWTQCISLKTFDLYIKQEGIGKSREASSERWAGFSPAGQVEHAFSMAVGLYEPAEHTKNAFSTQTSTTTIKETRMRPVAWAETARTPGAGALNIRASHHHKVVGSCTIRSPVCRPIVMKQPHRPA